MPKTTYGEETSKVWKHFANIDGSISSLVKHLADLREDEVANSSELAAARLKVGNLVERLKALFPDEQVESEKPKKWRKR